MPEDTIQPIATARYRDVRYPNFVGGTGDPNQPGTPTQPTTPTPPAPTAPGGGGGGGSPAGPRTRLGQLVAPRGGGEGQGGRGPRSPQDPTRTPEGVEQETDRYKRGRAALTAENLGRMAAFGLGIGPTTPITAALGEAAEEITGDDLGLGLPEYDDYKAPTEEGVQNLQSGNVTTANQQWQLDDAAASGGDKRGDPALSGSEGTDTLGAGFGAGDDRLTDGHSSGGGSAGGSSGGGSPGGAGARGYKRGGTVVPVPSQKPAVPRNFLLRQARKPAGYDQGGTVMRRPGNPANTDPVRPLPAFLRPPMARTAPMQRDVNRGGYAAGGTVDKMATYEAGGPVVDPAAVPDDGVVDNQPINADEGEFVITRDAAVALGPEVLQVINDPQMAPLVAQAISEMIGGEPAAGPVIDNEPVPPAPPVGGARPQTRLGNLRA
jgi:hypothetical protein